MLKNIWHVLLASSDNLEAGCPYLLVCDTGWSFPSKISPGVYPLVIKRGNGNSRTITCKWCIFHCYFWLPEGTYLFSWSDGMERESDGFDVYLPTEDGPDGSSHHTVGSCESTLAGDVVKKRMRHTYLRSDLAPGKFGATTTFICFLANWLDDKFQCPILCGYSNVINHPSNSWLESHP